MEISFSHAIFIYLTVFVLLFLFLWLFAGRKKKKEDFSLLEKRLWRCPVCGGTYVDSKNPEISRCPRCGSLNERQDLEEGGLYGGKSEK